MFLEAIPRNIVRFDASIYAVVKRKADKELPDDEFGKDVRIDPATLDWDSLMITANVPLNINHGIEIIEDLDDHWYEAVEAGFIALMQSCVS